MTARPISNSITPLPAAANDPVRTGTNASLLPLEPIAATHFLTVREQWQWSPYGYFCLDSTRHRSQASLREPKEQVPHTLGGQDDEAVSADRPGVGLGPFDAGDGHDFRPDGPGAGMEAGSADQPDRAVGRRRLDRSGDARYRPHPGRGAGRRGRGGQPAGRIWRHRNPGSAERPARRLYLDRQCHCQQRHLFGHWPARRHRYRRLAHLSFGCQRASGFGAGRQRVHRFRAAP
ncbi:hypothetical protein D3C87_1511870 [compost metagenome]